MKIIKDTDGILDNGFIFAYHDECIHKMVVAKNTLHNWSWFWMRIFGAASVPKSPYVGFDFGFETAKECVQDALDKGADVFEGNSCDDLKSIIDNHELPIPMEEG